MKKILSLIIILNFFVLNNYSQQSEFNIYPNGLIYSESTIRNLKQIVDSLNEKQEVRNKAYFSQKQALAHYITLGYGNVEEAKSDMNKDISFDEFIKKYPGYTLEDSLVTIKYISENYDNKKVIQYRNLAFNGNEHQIESDNLQASDSLKGKWVYYYDAGNEYHKHKICAFYFLSNFYTQQLPQKYERLINYSINIIDTILQFEKYPLKPQKDYSFKEQKKFIEYIANKTVGKQDWSNWKEKEHLDSLKLEKVECCLQHDEVFRKMLNTAFNEAIAFGSTGDEFEYYVGKYLSKKDELILKVSRHVYGQCSNDRSPRFHAQSIARLSAETMNWNTFIRYHLNIMNDKFERRSDGSYAWGTRKTYLKELEEINLNAINLLLGITFSVSNPSNNQYFGSAGRIGQALSDSKDPNRVTNLLSSYIQDNRLDIYNRVIMYYTFLSYLNNSKDSTNLNNTIYQLNNSIQALPSYIKKRIISKNYELETLLKDEIDTIKQNFDIIYSDIRQDELELALDSTGGDFGGERYWMAEFHPKGIKENILFLVNMEAGKTIGSIKPFLNQKDSLISRVKQINCFMNFLKEDSTNSVLIHFVKTKSFSNQQQNFFYEELPSYLKGTFKNLDQLIAVSLDKKDTSSSNWLIFPDNSIMPTRHGYHLPFSLDMNEDEDVNFKRFDLNGKQIKK